MGLAIHRVPLQGFSVCSRLRPPPPCPGFAWRTVYRFRASSGKGKGPGLARALPAV
jgi:hypothetical protein